MHSIENLLRTWNEQTQFQPVQQALALGQDGLTLGVGTILLKTKNGRIDPTGAEERLGFLLHRAYQAPIDPMIMPAIKRAAAAWNAGEPCLAQIHLAMARLPPLDPDAGARRLFFAAGMLDGGFTVETMGKIAGFDGDGNVLWKYNPNVEAQPRQGPGGPHPSWWTRGQDFTFSTKPVEPPDGTPPRLSPKFPNESGLPPDRVRPASPEQPPLAGSAQTAISPKPGPLGSGLLDFFMERALRRGEILATLGRDMQSLKLDPDSGGDREAVKTLLLAEEKLSARFGTVEEDPARHHTDMLAALSLELHHPGVIDSAIEGDPNAIARLEQAIDQGRADPDGVMADARRGYRYTPTTKAEAALVTQLKAEGQNSAQIKEALLATRNPPPGSVDAAVEADLAYQMRARGRTGDAIAAAITDYRQRMSNADSDTTARPLTPGFANRYDTAEESNLAQSLRARGKSSTEIQAALDTLRQSRDAEVDPSSTSGTAPPFDPGTPFDPEPLKTTIKKTRIQLKSDFKRGGNMAAAAIQIDGIPDLLIAHSRISKTDELPDIPGFVAETKQIFNTFKDYNNQGRLITRGDDTEVKILDNIAQRLSKNYQASGEINLFTELKPCKSCESVIDQFRKLYPNITVNVMDNKGIRLNPQNKGK